MIPLLIFGAIGGAARGLLGFTKYMHSYKNVTFSWRYFASMVGVSTIVGLGAVWVLKDSGMTFDGMAISDPIAAIIGYAGGDAIENVYKIILKKPVLVPKK